MRAVPYARISPRMRADVRCARSMHAQRTSARMRGEMRVVRACCALCPRCWLHLWPMLARVMLQGGRAVAASWLLRGCMWRMEWLGMAWVVRCDAWIFHLLQF